MILHVTLWPGQLTRQWHHDDHLYLGSAPLTWVKRLHVAVKETDIHAPHVYDVEQGCDDDAPHCQQHPDQNIDRKQQVRQQEQIAPVTQDRLNIPDQTAIKNHKTTEHEKIHSSNNNKYSDSPVV